jgi:hypothetical protein
MSDGLLHNLGLKYGTDKSTYHLYMDVYERHIQRDLVKNLLEIGVQGGYSLRAWREWLPEESLVHGWDIDEIPQIAGCSISKVDQSDRKQIESAVNGQIYDVIIDDGGHTPKLMETSFSFLFKYSKIYIIEDLHAWWLGYKDVDDKPTVDLLENINKTGWLSKYSSPEESEYIKKNAKVAEIFYRGSRENPTSMTAVIYNKERYVD